MGCRRVVIYYRFDPIWVIWGLWQLFGDRFLPRKIEVMRNMQFRRNLSRPVP